MSRQQDEKQLPGSLLPEQDEHVDVAVALGRRELAEAQVREVRARMQQDANYRAVVEPIALAYKEPLLSAEEVRSAWPKLVRAAGMPEAVAHAAVGAPVERDLVGRRRMISMLVGSVGALLFVVGGLGAWNYVSKARRYDTIRTGSEETLRVYLPDLTRATIGPSSELKFPQGMWHAGPDRVVWPKGTVTLEVARPEQTVLGSSGAGPLRIETRYAQVSVAARSVVRVEAVSASTLVVVRAGMARAWPRMPNQPEPTGQGIELKARSGARFTGLGMQWVRGMLEP